MPNSKRELVEIRSVSLYPKHWDTVDAYSREMGYGSTSAALRRIIDEWAQFKSVQLPLMSMKAAPAGE